MSYLYRAGLAEHERNNIKAKWAILDIVGCDKIMGGSVQFISFSIRDDRFSRLETFTGSGFHLDKNDSPVGSNHNKIDFTGLTGKIASELFETFAYKIPLAAFLTPSAEQLPVSQ